MFASARSVPGGMGHIENTGAFSRREVTLGSTAIHSGYAGAVRKIMNESTTFFLQSSTPICAVGKVFHHFGLGIDATTPPPSCRAIPLAAVRIAPIPRVPTTISLQLCGCARERVFQGVAGADTGPRSRGSYAGAALMRRALAHDRAQTFGSLDLYARSVPGLSPPHLNRQAGTRARRPCTADSRSRLRGPRAVRRTTRRDTAAGWGA